MVHNRSISRQHVQSHYMGDTGLSPGSRLVITLLILIYQLDFVPNSSLAVITNHHPTDNQRL